MAKARAAESPEPVVPPSATPPVWVRCTAAMTLTTRTGHVEHVWPGLVVNLARELAPGFTVGDALAGRPECYESCAGPADAPDGGKE